MADCLLKNINDVMDKARHAKIRIDPALLQVKPHTKIRIDPAHTSLSLYIYIYLYIHIYTHLYLHLHVHVSFLAIACLHYSPLLPPRLLSHTHSPLFPCSPLRNASHPPSSLCNTLSRTLETQRLDEAELQLSDLARAQQQTDGQVSRIAHLMTEMTDKMEAMTNDNNNIKVGYMYIMYIYV